MSDAPLSVLLWLPRAAEIVGGHVVQLRETAAALERIGVRVRVSLSPDSTLEDIDVVHGFGLSAKEVHGCRAAGLPVALSTIYWDRDYRKTGGPHRPAVREVLGRGRRSLRLSTAALRGEAQRADACWAAVASETALLASYEAADVLLPNAYGEAESLRSDFNVSTPIRMIPNAVDPDRFPMGDLSRDGVLYAGRIEPHKNQLGLIRALRGSGLRLTLAGPVHLHHQDYAVACRRAGKGWVEFTGPLTHDELSPLYQRAKVHVLPTWFETTGLVSLEAAMSGCEIVTTSRGHAREYFQDLAWYCDPAEPKTILQAIEHASAGTRKNNRLRERIASNFTWAHTAVLSLEVYRCLVERRTVR